jgi:hypothetical protein
MNKTDEGISALLSQVPPPEAGGIFMPRMSR